MIEVEPFCMFTGFPAPHAGAVSFGLVPDSAQLDQFPEPGDPLIFRVISLGCVSLLTSHTVTAVPSLDALAQQRTCPSGHATFTMRS